MLCTAGAFLRVSHEESMPARVVGADYLQGPVGDGFGVCLEQAAPHVLGFVALEEHDLCSRTAAHAMDLVTELGSATVSASGGELVEVPVGVLDELADLVERVVGRVDAGEWSICPCGEPHEQEEVDRRVVVAMNQDAAIARDLRATADQ